MTDKAVSALTSLTGANAATGDLIYIVDISEPSAADRSKKITAQELQNYMKAFPATIGVGGATPAASGAGISFPSAQSASSNANTLDDYEEGTWTPTDASGAGLTFSSAAGNYTKIGRQVITYFQATFPSTANSSQIKFGGLPFTSASVPAVSNPGGGGFTYQTANIQNASFAIGGGVVEFNIFSSSGSAIANSSASGATVRGFFTYFTD